MPVNFRSLRVFVLPIAGFISIFPQTIFAAIDPAAKEPEQVLAAEIVQADGPCFFVDPFVHFESMSEGCLLESLSYTNPNAWNRAGERLLHIAVTSNRADLIQLLVDMGADIYALDERGRTPRQFAVAAGNEAAIAELDRIERETSHLLLAIAEKNLNHVIGAIERGAALGARDFWHYTPFLVAAEAGEVEIAKALLSFGSSLEEENFKGDTALHLAIREERIAMVKFLSAESKLLNRQNNARESPLNIALYTGNENLLSVLRSRGAKHGQPSSNEVQISIANGEAIYPVPE